MLFTTFYFILACLLCFQGLHALGERMEPMGVVPEPVRGATRRQGTWGLALVGLGCLLLGTGLARFAYPALEVVLRPFQLLGLTAMGLYALWVIFGSRPVIYAQAAAPHQDHH